MRMPRLASFGFCLFLLALPAFVEPAPSRADVASDQSASIVVFPRIQVDTANAGGRGHLDTLVRLSNNSNQSVRAQCFWVNANGHCSTSPGTICDPSVLPRDPRCGTDAYCIPGWQETDFIINLTPRQPVAWLASLGASLCDAATPADATCFPIRGSGVPGPSNNAESRVPAVLEDPFVGELRCIAVDQNDVPVARNVLQGEAEFVRFAPGVEGGGDAGTPLDLWGYNAIGIPAIPGANNGDNALVIGGRLAEYEGCPNVLILNHFFDGAADPVSDLTVSTRLTLVPCSQDFLRQEPIRTPLQFLVFNEFEQRFSTSFRDFACFREFSLSRIDTRSASHSIFSAGVSGTLVGQTRIRGVADSDPARGHAILGVAEEFREGGGTAAFNVHFQGARPQSDFIYLPFQ